MIPVTSTSASVLSRPDLTVTVAMGASARTAGAAHAVSQERRIRQSPQLPDCSFAQQSSPRETGMAFDGPCICVDAIDAAASSCVTPAAKFEFTPAGPSARTSMARNTTRLRRMDCAMFSICHEPGKTERKYSAPVLGKTSQRHRRRTAVFFCWFDFDETGKWCRLRDSNT